MTAGSGTAVVATTIDFRSAEEARIVIDRALERVEADPDAGPALRAIGLSQQLELTDLGLAVSVVSSATRERCLEWSFGERSELEPRLLLRMSGATANRFLQGCESAAIGIARGAIEVIGSSRAALAYLPAMRHLSRCYAAVVAAEHPHLVCRR